MHVRSGTVYYHSEQLVKVHLRTKGKRAVVVESLGLDVRLV